MLPLDEKADFAYAEKDRCGKYQNFKIDINALISPYKFNSNELVENLRKRNSMFIKNIK